MQRQLERRLVGPVQVVEDQRERPLPPEQLEQGTQRAVEAEALGGRGAAGRGRRRSVRPEGTRHAAAGRGR
jgi:hypothetical protein